MPGIEDLTNIMVAGGRDDIPGGPPPPPMGGPPMGGPPMGGPAPLPMGDPAAAETLMANADMLQGDMQRPPMEGPGGGIEQDAMALADAVVGRAEGDINAALAILDGATEILIGSQQQEQPLMAAHGRAISDRDRDLFTETGRTSSDKDIMYANAQAGKTLSDKDREFTKERLQKIIDYENY
jgi:hypothetical protein